VSTTDSRGSVREEVEDWQYVGARDRQHGLAYQTPSPSRVSHDACLMYLHGWQTGHFACLCEVRSHDGRNVNMREL